MPLVKKNTKSKVSGVALATQRALAKAAKEETTLFPEKLAKVNALLEKAILQPHNVAVTREVRVNKTLRNNSKAQSVIKKK